jgi:recombination protein RecR
MYPQAVANLIEKFAKLPSIGPKTAERLVFHLLRQKPEELSALAEDLIKIKNTIIKCGVCHNFSESNPCPICSGEKRNRKIICVVSKPQDIEILEKTRSFNGLYFVLGKNINPLNSDHENSRIKELVTRISQDQPEEVILALNPDLSGETTILYLKKLLERFQGLKISRLARGLPMGADIEYADEITLENAILGRQNLK